MGTKSKKSLGVRILFCLFWIVFAIIFISIFMDGMNCMSEGGTYVKGFPWYTCIK